MMACLTTVKDCIHIEDVVKNKKKNCNKKERTGDKKKKYKKEKWRNCKYFNESIYYLTLLFL